MTQDRGRGRQGRVIALVIAATGLGWIGVQVAGAALGLSQNVLVLFDMLAAVGFVVALWMSYGLWRYQGERREKTDKD